MSDAAREAAEEARKANAQGPAHQQGVYQATMPMQRRQYEAIAGAINSFPNNPDIPKADLAQHFADSLRGTNPNFDSGKFKTAAMTGNMGRTQGKAPGMTRGHYQAVAGAINSLPSGWRGPVAQHFAGELGRSNANFKPARFLKAAGG